MVLGLIRKGREMPQKRGRSLPGLQLVMSHHIPVRRRLK